MMIRCPAGGAQKAPAIPASSFLQNDTRIAGRRKTRGQLRPRKCPQLQAFRGAAGLVDGVFERIGIFEHDPANKA